MLKQKNNEDKITDIANLATNATLNAKINEVKNEIHSITNLVTTTVLLAVNNINNLVKKGDQNTKTSEIENESSNDHDHDKYITNQEFNELAA